ncbi:MAG: hypothetical protein HYX69_21535 [Planctomycetia bacterium]|nr:hypothetical protein [Planctomycetia bacterium]
MILASVAAIYAAFAATASADELPRELAPWFAPQDWERDVDAPIVSLGKPGVFDDMHIFAPAVVLENGRYSMWYCGSRGTRVARIFRLGLATSADGKGFEKYAENPVLAFGDGERSILTPAPLRHPDGSVLREGGKLRMWLSATAFGKSGLHTLHESTSADGIHWAEPSPPLLESVYCPTVLKTDRGYEMWYSDVSRRPWIYRHAVSADGSKWQVDEQPVLQLSQDWEAEVLVYPTVLKVDGAYLMWYGSYDTAVRRQTTAIGFAVSRDGMKWHKHPRNPVLRPDPERPWESNYVGSGCVMRLADGSFRYWYASRKKPPFENLYFAINTARWTGPREMAVLPLPPRKGDIGVFAPANPADDRRGKSLDVLEVIDEHNAVVRAWYAADAVADKRAVGGEPTFVDVWIHGIDTRGLVAGSPARLPHVFRVTGNKQFDTTCGGRSMPALEPVDVERAAHEQR